MSDDVITAISPKPSNPNQRRVRIGRRTVAVLNESAVERLGLHVDMPWTPELAERVERELELERARRAGLTMISRRPVAIAALRSRLSAKGFADDIVDQVIASFTREGWLDDRALAEELAAQIIRRSPCSREFLRRKLEAKAIGPDIAAHAADAALADVDGIDQANRVAQKAMRSAARLSPARQAKRVAGALQRRGFDDDTITLVLDRLDLMPTDDGA